MTLYDPLTYQTKIETVRKLHMRVFRAAHVELFVGTTSLTHVIAVPQVGNLCTGDATMP